MAPNAWALAVTLLVRSSRPSFRESKLAALVAEVRSADYRGDRAALARLDAALGELDDAALADYRDYWRGFARWRRALNGFNETPTPTDLTADLESAVAHFRASLERRPDWIEAKLALVGCWGNLTYPRRQRPGEEEAAPRRARPGVPLARGERRATTRAPSGSSEACSSPPHRPTGATSSRRPPRCGGASSSPGASRPRARLARLGPAWGGPENLMNLAYMYSHVGDARPGRGPRLRGGRGHGGARVALRPRHPAAADRGAPAPAK